LSTPKLKDWGFQVSNIAQNFHFTIIFQMQLSCGLNQKSSILGHTAFFQYFGTHCILEMFTSCLKPVFKLFWLEGPSGRCQWDTNMTRYTMWFVCEYENIKSLLVITKFIQIIVKIVKTKKNQYFYRIIIKCFTT